jgi:hypothetical protein
MPKQGKGVKPKAKENLVDARGAYTMKKVRAPENAGPLEPKKVTGKPKLNRSEAAKLVWKEKRAKIIAGIKRAMAERKKTAAVKA